MDSAAAKKAAAVAAIAELPLEGIVGLGTGSTAWFFVEEVGALVRSGRNLTGVPTSEATRAHALSLGIPLVPGSRWEIDVTVDGADEVADDLALSKGAGGALLREKIVAHASKKLVIVCDASKRVARLGATRPISIEIVPFGHATTLTAIAAFGTPALRRKADGSPVNTDHGNLLVDLAVPSPLADPAALDRELHAIPGVVETGIFVGYADVVLVARDDGRIERIDP